MSGVSSVPDPGPSGNLQIQYGGTGREATSRIKILILKKNPEEL